MLGSIVQFLVQHWLLSCLGLTGGGIGITTLLGGGPWLLLAAKGALGWLSKRSLAEIGCIALGIACAALIVANRAEKRHSEKLQARVNTLSIQLQRISDARQSQKQTTAEKIKVVTRTLHDADERAQAVEKAPPAANCRTKPEVMGADL
jgi:hypothetical protein